VDYELIIIRYGEIALKGKETRKSFENTLTSNIKNAFSMEKISFELKKEWGRIYVYTSQIKDCIDVLKRIFGIVSVSPAIQTKSDMDSISNLAVKVSKEKLVSTKSFAVRSTRTGVHDYTSQDVAIKIGEDIVKTIGAQVDLSNPDFELFIEIRDDKAYLFTEKINGTGGLPLGTQGNIIALIEDYQSIFSSWHIMRRGCNAVFVVTDASRTDQLKSFTSKWFVEPVIYEIDPKKPDFYKKLIEIADEQSCSAIVTGDCLCNNIDEDISKIKSFSKRVTIPVLQPLIAMEKQEIDKKLEELGIKK
jgi:thiamine biosynthesis protein ThiI